MKTYLCGFICGNKLASCIEWRKKIRDHYENWKDAGYPYPIEWLDPLNGDVLSSITGDGLASSVDPHVIIHRDYQSVLKSDLIVANLDTFGEERPPIGTICEIALGWEHHKPIIIITENDKYREHPFLAYFASAFVKNVADLLERKLINYMYKGWVSAKY